MTNKKEPLSVKLSKMILAVSVIISLGTIFGVMGYLASNPSKTIVPILNTFVKKEIGVVVSTDKMEYEQGEVVKIKMESDTNFDYFKIYWPYYTVLKKEDGEWKDVAREFCLCPDVKCKIETPSAKDFSKNLIIGEEWDQKIAGCDNEGDKLGEREQAESGVYMISVEIPAYTNNGFNVFYSNEFTIKEKTVVNQNVVISTDKTEYNQSETIKIVVNNGLDKSILYSGWGGRFWDIQYFKDDKWINPAHEENGGFQLTKENVGDACNIALYERAYPEELTSQSNLTTEWNQKICPFTENPYIYKSIVRYIESGKYRLVFYYGFEISDSDEFRISEPKKVYSNEFTIKEISK